MTLRHGAPVEQVAWLPGGSLLVSVGGQDVCVWDALAGGKRLHKLRCHQKTVMCAHVARDGGPPPVSGEHDDDVFAGFSRTAGAHKSATDRAHHPRLLTGSLDGHVKVHELDGFSVTHSARYPGPVLSVALSPDAQVLAVGTANRLLSIRRRSRGSRRGVGTEEGVRGGSASGGEERRSGGGGGRELGNPKPPPPGRGVVAVLRAGNGARRRGRRARERRRRARLAPHDHALRRFRYGEALDAALAGGRAEVVAAVIEEIGRRGGLKTALAGRDAAGLGPVLRFIARHVANPRHSRQLAGVTGEGAGHIRREIGASKEVDAALRARATASRTRSNCRASSPGSAAAAARSWRRGAGDERFALFSRRGTNREVSGSFVS